MINPKWIEIRCLDERMYLQLACHDHYKEINNNITNLFHFYLPETKPIAFYAEMSSDFESKGPGTKLIFDRIFTNVDNAYSDKTGVYKVPKTGMYVFNWRHREFYSQHSVELMVDKDVRGATFKRAQNNDDASVSGTAVLEVKEGDEVYLRFHPELDGQETLVNNLHGRSTFSGWRLRWERQNLFGHIYKKLSNAWIWNISLKFMYNVG